MDRKSQILAPVSSIKRWNHMGSCDEPNIFSPFNECEIPPQRRPWSGLTLTWRGVKKGGSRFKETWRRRDSVSKETTAAHFHNIVLQRQCATYYSRQFKLMTRYNSERSLSITKMCSLLKLQGNIGCECSTIIDLEPVELSLSLTWFKEWLAWSTHSCNAKVEHSILLSFQCIDVCFLKG